MGDLLRMVVDHPTAELVGICDGQPERMAEAIRACALRPDQVFTDVEVWLERTALSGS